VRLHRSIAAGTGVKTLDVAKRLLDYGFHSPTIYFPLVVSRRPHDRADRRPKAGRRSTASSRALTAIVEEARTDPERVKSAPHTTRVRRLDETRAARRPVLRWRRAATASSDAEPT
jgi:glycine dehydrogenase subunit 2